MDEALDIHRVLLILLDKTKRVWNLRTYSERKI